MKDVSIPGRTFPDCVRIACAQADADGAPVLLHFWALRLVVNPNTKPDEILNVIPVLQSDTGDVTSLDPHCPFRSAVARIFSLLHGGCTVAPAQLAPERAEEAVQAVSALITRNRDERLRLHQQRPEAYVPDGVGVSLPLPTGPERTGQIRARLEAAVMIEDPTGQFGWQVYAQSTVSTGKMEALLERDRYTRTYEPPTEYTIHTAYPHGQLKGPAPVVSRMGGPYQYPSDLSALRPADATFIAHTPADIAYLLARTARLENALACAEESLTRLHTDLEAGVLIDNLAALDHVVPNLAAVHVALRGDL
ncbi:hypothetical protein [Deinococcus sp. PEB2-67]